MPIAATTTISDRRVKCILGLGIVFFIAIFFALTYWKYTHYLYNALDLAIINQAFFTSSQGDFFTSSIHPPSYLADHFSPLLLLITPIYHVFKHPLALIGLQIISLGAAAYPLYLVARQQLSPLCSLLIALGWLINPFVANATLFEFHFLAFAPLVVFFAYHCYQRRWFVRYVLLLLLLLLVREDAALVVFMFGVLAAAQGRSVRWWLPPLLVSPLYFMGASAVINQAAAGGYKFLIYYSWLGSGWLEVLQTMITRPWLVLFRLLHPTTLLFAVGLLLPVAFLPLLSPLPLVLAALVFLQLILGTGGSATLLELHYTTLLLPAIFISAAAAVDVLLKKRVGAAALLLRRHWPLTIVLILTAIIYSSLTLGPVPGAIAQIITADKNQLNLKMKNELVAAVPKNAAVAASYDLLAPLSSRTDIVSLNYVFLGKQQFLQSDYALPESTEYLAVDFADLLTYQLQYGANPFYQEQYETANKSWQNLFAEFSLIKLSGTVALFQKNATPVATLVERLPDDSRTAAQTFAGQLELVDWNQSAPGQYEFYWRNQSSTSRYLNVHLQKDGEKPTIVVYPLTYGFVDTDNILRTTIVLPPLPSGTYQITVEVIEVIGGGIDVTPLRSTVSTIDRFERLGKLNVGSATLP